MDNPNVPVENAHEPAEEARQPSNNSPRGPSKLKITFADDTDTSEKCSQKSIGYKEALSQPPASFGHKQRLEWLQHRRSAGLYVQCDSCDSWRYLPQVLDKYDLPEKWYCSMNPDKAFANCFIPEVPLHIREEEDLIHAEYSAGSVVWARMAGWPWWPAMVDDCPDAEEYYWLDGFSDIPTHYNVVFFDTLDVTRAWISPDNLKPFGTNKNLLRHGKEKKYKKRLEVAIKQANDANNLPLQIRLAKYSFISRYAGKISTPRKINQHEIRKFKAAMKRKFNVDFPVESSSDSDADVAPTETINKKHIKKSKTTKHNKKENDQRKSSTKKNNKTKSSKNKNVEINGNNEKESNDDNEREISANNETEISDNNETEITANNESEITANNESEINGKNDKECELKNKDDDLTNVIDTTQDIPLSTQTSDVPEIIQDSLMANNTQETAEDVSKSFVKPNSLVVQLGSTANDDTCAIDNDSSTTYAPESQTDNNTMSEIINDLEDRAASPGSDDFDF